MVLPSSTITTAPSAATASVIIVAATVVLHFERCLFLIVAAAARCAAVFIDAGAGAATVGWVVLVVGVIIHAHVEVASSRSSLVTYTSRHKTSRQALGREDGLLHGVRAAKILVLTDKGWPTVAGCCKFNGSSSKESCTSEARHLHVVEFLHDCRLQVASLHVEAAYALGCSELFLSIITFELGKFLETCEPGYNILLRGTEAADGELGLLCIGGPMVLWPIRPKFDLRALGKSPRG